MPSSQKVAVFGAHGKVGKIIISKLKSNPHEFKPLAILRSEEQAKEPVYQEVATSITSIEGSVDKICLAVEGQDAVIFSAGAGGSGLDKTFAIDLDGAVKVMEACKTVGVNRFVMVSAIGAEIRNYWYDRVPQLRSYYIAKKYADRELRRTDLNYTILQPGHLVDEEETGKLGPNVDHKDLAQLESVQGDITRADVAQVAVDVLKFTPSYKKTLTLLNGDIPIKDYLRSV